MSEHWSEEQTDDPQYADLRNFYKVEKWSRDSMRVEELLYAGSSLDKALAIFSTMVRHWPRIQLTIRQRTRVQSDACSPLENDALCRHPCVRAINRFTAKHQIEGLD